MTAPWYSFLAATPRVADLHAATQASGKKRSEMA